MAKVNVTEQHNKVIVQADGTVRVVSVGIAGPAGPKGDPGDLQAGTAGDMLVHGATAWDVLPAGTDGQIIASVSGVPSWSNALTAHATDTTDVHGVADTAALETQVGAQSKVDTHSGLDTGIHGVGLSTVESVEGSQAKVTAHDVNTGVHGVGASTVESVAGAQAKADAVLPAPGADGTVLTLALGEPAWAAPEGGGGGGPQVVSLRSSSSYVWHQPGWLIKSLTETSVGRGFNGDTHFVPIVVDRDRTIDAVGVRCTTADANSYVRIGIYNLDPVAGVPSTVLLDAGTVDTSTTGEKIIVLATPLELSAGAYFSAVAVNGAPSLRGLGTTNIYRTAVEGHIPAVGDQSSTILGIWTHLSGSADGLLDYGGQSLSIRNTPDTHFVWLREVI